MCVIKEINKGLRQEIREETGVDHVGWCSTEVLLDPVYGFDVLVLFLCAGSSKHL